MSSLRRDRSPIAAGLAMPTFLTFSGKSHRPPDTPIAITLSERKLPAIHHRGCALTVAAATMRWQLSVEWHALRSRLRGAR